MRKPSAADRAWIWAARGQVREAAATIEAARQILAGSRSVLLRRADELEALLRLSLGDPCTPAELADGLPPAQRGLLLARIALASGDHRAAAGHLHSPSLGDLTPRRALVRQLLLAAAAIERPSRRVSPACPFPQIHREFTQRRVRRRGRRNPTIG